MDSQIAELTSDLDRELEKIQDKVRKAIDEELAPRCYPLPADYYWAFEMKMLADGRMLQITAVPKKVRT